MPIPILATVLSAVGPALAKKGLDLLSGVFNSAVDKGTEVASDVIDKQVQKVADKIREKTGIEIGDIAEEKLTDEQWRQLKAFELQEQELLLASRAEMSAIELEREKAILQDRQDARATGSKRDQNEDTVIRRFTYYYAYLITGITFLFIIIAIIIPAVLPNFPKESWQVINTVVGFLLGVGLSAIIQYFYGSSMGSKNKEQIMKDQQLLSGGKKS